METGNRLGEKRCRGQNHQLFPGGVGPEAERGHAIGYDDPIDGRIGQNFRCSRHEEAVRHQGQDAPGSGLARRPRGAQQRAAGADHVVDDEGGTPRHIADEEIARDTSRRAKRAVQSVDEGQSLGNVGADAAELAAKAAQQVADDAKAEAEAAGTENQ